MGQGKRQPQPFRAHGDQLAEALDDAALGGLHLEEAAAQPQRERSGSSDA